MTLFRSLSAFSLGVVTLLSTAGAWAQQSYPNRPVKIIVPFAASGPADNYARFMAQRLQDALGQPFVVETAPVQVRSLAPMPWPNRLLMATPC